MGQLRQQIADLKMINTQLENALQQSEARFDTFFNLVPIAIYTKDTEGRYTSANADTLTYWSENPVGYTDAELLPVEIATKLRAVDLQVMEADQECYVEEELIRQGVLCTLLSRKVPIRNQHNKVIGIIGISIDISERKLVEQQHLQLEVEKERLKLLSDFITQVSHEFRTPLSIIQTSSYMMSKIGNDPDKRQHYLSKIKQQSQNIDSLIKNMLTLFVLNSEQIQTTEKIAINLLLQNIYDKKLSKSGIERVASVLELSENPLIVQGNVGCFTQAIECIWDNAEMYTSCDDDIMIRSGFVDGNVYVDIIDTGIGICDDDLLHIFESFYRVDKAGSTRGFGLGLAIAKAVFDKFNGKIEVESAIGQGSTFRILLPKA